MVAVRTAAVVKAMKFIAAAAERDLAVDEVDSWSVDGDVVQ